MNEQRETPFTYRNNDTNYAWTIARNPGKSGQVYIGVDTTTREPVIIKETDSRKGPDIRAAHAQDIARETYALKQMNEAQVKGVPVVLDDRHHVTGNGPRDYINDAYMVTTVAAGKTFDKFSEIYRMPGKQFYWSELMNVMTQVTHVLTRAHQLGLLHNDMKLEHIFWDRTTKQVTVIDWGNTVFYRDEGANVLPIADVVEMAKTIYQAITGRLPEKLSGYELDFGTATPPTTLVALLRDALAGDVKSMAEFHNRLNAIYQGVSAQDQAVLTSMRAELSQAANVTALEALRNRVLSWPLREAFEADVNDLLNDIDAKSRQAQLIGYWQTAKSLLEEDCEYSVDMEYEIALANLDVLVKVAPSEVTWATNLHVLHVLAGYMAKLTDIPEGSHQILTHLVNDNIPDAYKLALSLWQNGNAEPAAKMLSLLAQMGNLDWPTVFASLNTLMVDTLAAGQGSTQHLSQMLSIMQDVNGLIEQFRDATADIDAQITVYDNAISVLRSLQDKLTSDLPTVGIADMLMRARVLPEEDCETPQLTLLAWLRSMQNGASRIVEKLKKAQSTWVRGSSEFSFDLQDAKRLDMSNTPLQKLELIAASDIRADVDALSRKPVNSSDDILELIDVLKGLMAVAPPVEGFKQVREEAITLDEAWTWIEDNGADQGVVERANHLMAAVGAARKFPTLQQYLMSMQQDAAPWIPESGANAFSQAVSRAVDAWNRGDLGSLNTEYREAEKTLGLRGKNQPEFKWLSWISALNNCVLALRASDMDKARIEVANASKAYSSEEVMFLGQWLDAKESYERGEYQDALMQLNTMATRSGRVTGYEKDLQTLRSSIQNKLNEGRVVDVMKQGQYEQATQMFADMAELPIRSKLRDYKDAIDGVFRAEMDFERGDYEQALAKLDSARRGVSSLYDEEAKLLQTWIDIRLDSARFIQGQLNSTNQGLRRVDEPEAEHWDMIAKALAAIQDELVDYPDANIHNYIEAHNQLRGDFFAGMDPYAHTKQMVRSQYPNLPFWDTYRRWKPRKTMGDNLVAVKDALIEGSFNEAFRLLNSFNTDQNAAFLRSPGRAWLDILESVRQGWMYIAELKFIPAQQELSIAVEKANALPDPEVSTALVSYGRTYRDSVDDWLTQMRQAVTEAEQDEDVTKETWNNLYRVQKTIHTAVTDMANGNENTMTTTAFLSSKHIGMGRAYQKTDADAYNQHLAEIKTQIGENHPYYAWYAARAKDLGKGGGPVSTILTVVGALIAVIVLTIAIIVGIRSCSDGQGGGAEDTTEPTPTTHGVKPPDATKTPTTTPTPEGSPAKSKEVTDVCDLMQEAKNNEDWAGALKHAVDLQDYLGGDYASIVQPVIDQSDFAVDYRGIIIEAGVTLAKQEYDEGQQLTEENRPRLAMNAYETSAVNANDAWNLVVDLYNENDPALLPLLRYRACASYKVFDIENSKEHSTDLTDARTQAREALNALLPYEDLGAFYSEFSTLCGVEFFTASDVVVEPTATPTPTATTPPPPPTKKPDDNGNGDNGTGGITCQPVAPTALVWPNPNNGFPSGWEPDKPFQWEGGDLCNKQYSWQVKFATIDGDPLGPDCPPTQDSLSFCTLPSYAGEIQWWVAATNADGTQTFVESEKRILNLQESNGGNLCPDGSKPRPDDNPCP